MNSNLFCRGKFQEVAVLVTIYNYTIVQVNLAEMYETETTVQCRRTRNGYQMMGCQSRTGGRNDRYTSYTFDLTREMRYVNDVWLSGVTRAKVSYHNQGIQHETKQNKQYPTSNRKISKFKGCKAIDLEENRTLGTREGLLIYLYEHAEGQRKM